MTEEQADQAPQDQGQVQPEAAAEAPAAAPEAEQAGEANAESAPQEAAPEPDRSAQIKTLQGEVKALENQIVEEKRTIGQELIGQDSIPTERQEMLPLLEQGATLKTAKSERESFRDTIQQNMDQLASTQAQKKNIEAQRGEEHKIIAAKYVAVGRAGYQSYLNNAALQGPLGELFVKIVELDKKIAEKTAEKAALEEQKKQGFFSKVKATVSGFTVSIPKESDRDKVFAVIGGQIMANDEVSAQIGSEDIAAIMQELAEPIQKLRAFDQQLIALGEQATGFQNTLVELKGEASTPKARLDSTKKEIAAFEAQLNAVLMPLADAFLQPDPDTAGRTPNLEAALGRLKEAAMKRTHARTQIARLNAEIRVDQIVKEREGILQKRHKVAQELAGYDRRLADLHEEHVRHHAFITKIAQGGAVDLDGDEEKKETLVAVGAAPLEADKVTNSSGRGRLNIATPGGQTLYVELFGGQGFLFGRSHHDQRRGIRNDWVCRALPQDSPESSTKTRRISKVSGAFRGGTTPNWYMVDWSTAGITLDRAPCEKNGWIEIPAEPTVIDIANGAVTVTAHTYPSESLLLRRPADEGRWYALINGSLGLMVNDGALSGTSPNGGMPGFNILFKDGHFGLSPRGGAPVNLNGAPLASPQLLENNAVIEYSGYSMSFNALDAGEPAL